MVQMPMYLSYPSRKSKMSIFCVGVIKFFFWALFLDVFFDADSDGIWVFDFGPPGAEKSRFFWFWTPHREILLSHFFKKSKICSKVAQMGLILFRILHWLLCCSLFGSSSYHLRKNCQKPPKNRPKIYWSGTEMQAYLINERWHQFLILSCLFVIFPRIK